MLGAFLKSTTLLSIFLLGNVEAFSQENPEVIPAKAEIYQALVKPKVHIVGCTKIIDAVEAFFNEKKRFEIIRVKDPLASRLILKCTETTLEVRWKFANKQNKKQMLKNKVVVSGSMDDAVRTLLQPVFDKVPWHAEVLEISAVKSKIFADEDGKTFQQSFARIGVLDVRVKSAPCQSFKIAQIKVGAGEPKFEVVGFGVLLSPKEVGADAKIYLMKDLPLESTLYVAFAKSITKASIAGRLASECEIMVMNAASSPDGLIPAGGPINGENRGFDISAISQYFGLFGGTYNGKNGTSSGPLLGVLTENRISMKYFLIDMRGAMSLYAPAKKNEIDKKEYKPKLIAVEVSFGPRYRSENFIFALGLGAFLTLANVPYDGDPNNEVDAASTRSAAIIPGVFAQVGYFYKQHFSLWTRLGLGKTSKEGETAFGLTLLRGMSNTWRAGMDIGHARVSASTVDNSPAFTATTFGFVIGFELGK